MSTHAVIMFPYSGYKANSEHGTPWAPYRIIRVPAAIGNALTRSSGQNGCSNSCGGRSTRQLLLPLPLTSRNTSTSMMCLIRGRRLFVKPRGLRSDPCWECNRPRRAAAAAQWPRSTHPTAPRLLDTLSDCRTVCPGHVIGFVRFLDLSFPCAGNVSAVA
jgi:hypothetical protein